MGTVNVKVSDELSVYTYGSSWPKPVALAAFIKSLDAAIANRGRRCALPKMVHDPLATSQRPVGWTYTFNEA